MSDIDHMAGGPAQPPGPRRLPRRRILKGAALAGLGLAASWACRRAGDPPLTTLDSAIILDPDGSLARGPGEPYSVRTELAQARSGREAARRSVIVFHHFSDFRITDEESPLRSEWVESCPTPFATSAFRPHESLSAQAAAALVAAANRVGRSPVTGRPVDFAVHTGNAADNAQFNELRWFLDLMDGREVSPSSGAPAYEGVQTESPSPAYPDLLEVAQRPFKPGPLRYPWYTVIGVRDVLAQGSVPPSESITTSATGSSKIMAIGPEARDEVCTDPSTLLAPDSVRKILSDPQTVVKTVTPDENRRLLSRREWVEEHFRTSDQPGPLGHGLSQGNRDQGTAYYVVELGAVALIVLDTVNPGGFSAGSMDLDQFLWLEQQLIARSGSYFDAAGRPVTSGNRDSLIIVASHHTVAAMNNPFPGQDGDGNRVRGPQLEELLHRFPNVVLHIAGHAQEHRIAARPDPSRRTNGYWEITTASPGDYPMQGRLLEIVDNTDGTLSIFSTVYDSLAPIAPGDAGDPSPGDGVNELRLASVARRLSIQDPQLNRKAAGLAEGDRNAELLLPAPFQIPEAAGAPRRLPRRQLLRALRPRA